MRAALSSRLFLNCILCSFLLTGCHLFKKEDPAKAADDFFKLIVKGRYVEAYDNSSVMFQMQINEKSFEAIMRDLGLEEYASATWAGKKLEGNEARLDGEILGTGGQKMHVVLTLVQDSGQWKVFSMLTPASLGSSRMVNLFGGVGKGNAYGSAFVRPTPDEKEIRLLVAETMSKFNRGLHREDFSELYESISDAWKKQTTKGQMELAFKHFIYEKVKIDGIETTEPVFDELPRLNSEGILLVTGHYPTKPEAVVFELKYVFELPKWKLIGITVTMK
jgi:hypothetical protein